MLKRLLFETKFSAKGVARAGLCAIDIGLGLFFLKFLSTSTARLLPPIPTSLDILIQYIPNFLVLGISGSFFVLAYAVWQQRWYARSLAISTAITCIVPLWLLLIFAQLFGTKFLLLCMVVIIAVAAILLWRTSLKIVGVISLITIILTGLSFLSGFEEDYCSQKGMKADPKGRMTEATQQDAAILKTYGVTEGQPINIGYRAHMLCHTTFHFSDALKETISRK